MRIDREHRRIYMSQPEADALKAGHPVIDDDVKAYLLEVGATFVKPKSEFFGDVQEAESHNRFMGVAVVVE